MALRLRFGEFELDVAAYVLRSKNEDVRLERLPMELLMLLIEARGALVDRARIQAALWPNGVFLDHQAAINTAAKKLRRALGDPPEHPRYIETVVGKGYRFVAAVHDASGDAPVARAHSPSRTFTDARRFPKYRIRRGPQEFALDDGDHVIGRDPDATVYIDHPSVSRRHALISIRTAGASIEDLGSRNGTFVEGRRIDGRTELHDGAIVSAGLIVMTFQVVSAPASTQPISGNHLRRS